MKTYTKKFFSECQQHFGDTQDLHFVLGLSGGPDSIFLGEILSQSCDPQFITAAHFNHCLRPDSGDDEEFCSVWAQEKNIPFISEKWNTPVASEEKARTARYDFFEHVRQRTKSDVIVVGTHADDNAETIFFRFLRGSGLTGLSGITPFCPHRHIFRPLLSYRKPEILHFLSQQNIPFCTDSTNSETVFSRNFLRNDIFPALEKRFPDFATRIIRQSNIFREAEDFCRVSAESFCQQYTDTFPRDAFRKHHSALQSRILQHLFSPVSLDCDQICSAQNFIAHGASGKKMSIGKQGEEKTLLLSHMYFFIS